MDADQPILRQTQLLLWMLCLTDLNYSTYCALEPPKQLALAAAYGLDAGGLAIALEQVTMAYRAKLEQLKRIDEAQRRGAS